MSLQTQKTHTITHNFFVFVSHHITSHHITSHHITSHHTTHQPSCSSITSIQERFISGAHIVILVEVLAACVTYQRESTGSMRVTREVGEVIKSSITCKTDAVFVLVTFFHSFFMRKFESRNMSHLRFFNSQYCESSSSSSSSPVVVASSCHFVRLFVCSFVI